LTALPRMKRARECYPDHGMDTGTLLAAVDLGSNCYRLELGRSEHGQIRRAE
jgi:exopolyphosphatase/guanosine-5'-triphosphate,3'-diphosphate pyrophosphatase